MDLKPESKEAVNKEIKKNNIWSNALIETDLCEDVCSKFLSFDSDPIKTDLNSIVKQDRNVEAYDFIKLMNPKISPDKLSNKNHLSSIDYNKAKQAVQANLTKPLINKRNLSERIGPLVQYNENKSREHILANEFDSDELVTKEIAKHLNEPKLELIKRVVSVLGKKKALELLYATEDIQESGGMLTSEGDRYRTAGGVYIQLLRKDDSLLNCQRKKIFIEDAERKKRQKQAKRLQQRKRFNLAKQQLKEKVENSSKREDNEEVEEGEENDQDTLNGIKEEELIYFDE